MILVQNSSGKQTHNRLTSFSAKHSARPTVRVKCYMMKLRMLLGVRKAGHTSG